MPSISGNARLRQVLTATTYGVANPRVALISTAVQNSRNWAGTLRSVGSRLPVISYVIVGAINVVEWLALPETERELADLAGTLIVDLSKMAAAALGAAIAAVGVVALGGPLWVVVAAGVIGGIVVGGILDWADNNWGVTAKVQLLARESEQGFVEFLQRRESSDWYEDEPIVQEGWP